MYAGALAKKKIINILKWVNRFVVRNRKKVAAVSALALLLAELLETEADVNQADDSTHGQTKLFASAQEGYAKVVRALLKAGANVNQADTTNGCTPLYVSAQIGHVEVVRVLLEAGADVNQAGTTHGRTSLYVSYLNGHVEVLRTLLEAGAVIDQGDDSTGNPSSIAATCVVCLSAPKNCVLLPCKHMVMCAKCTRVVLESNRRHQPQCPVCRVHISDCIYNVHT